MNENFPLAGVMRPVVWEQKDVITAYQAISRPKSALLHWCKPAITQLGIGIYSTMHWKSETDPPQKTVLEINFH